MLFNEGWKSMNRTQLITSDWLLKSGLRGKKLLLEALLRRGFLAYADAEGVWLGTGSHFEDVYILELIDGLKVDVVTNHRESIGEIIYDTGNVPTKTVAQSIIAIPEHRGMSGQGLGVWGVQDNWSSYTAMRWGAKMAICPTQNGEIPTNENTNALDLGVALLVKAFPLACVATAGCCDGHGEEGASVRFNFKWDAWWGKCVFDVLNVDIQNSEWDWGIKNNEKVLTINPLFGFEDTSVKGMLDDIQKFSRQLLNKEVIGKIRRARAKTLEQFSIDESQVSFFITFDKVARQQLAKEFAI